MVWLLIWDLQYSEGAYDFDDLCAKNLDLDHEMNNVISVQYGFGIWYSLWEYPHSDSLHPK